MIDKSIVFAGNTWDTIVSLFILVIVNKDPSIFFGLNNGDYVIMYIIYSIKTDQLSFNMLL